MNRRPFHISLLTAIALIFSFSYALPSFAANPGEEIINSSGSVAASGNQIIPIFEANDANLRMVVSGGAPSDLLTFSVRRGGSPIASWVVRSGETTWGYAGLQNGDQIRIENAGATALSYTLLGFARSNLPDIGQGLTSWSGVARGVGTQSTAQFNVTTAGLYSFTLAANSGSFQLKVDENAILKTAAQGVALDPADSTYYLAAGPHTFRIIQNAATTLNEWSITLATAGALDTLPSSESSGVLGGGFFSEEWVPLQIDADQMVNIKVTVTGAATDSLVAELYNGTTGAFSSANIFGGEIAWGTSQLTAGANALRIVTAGTNAAPLGYAVTIEPIGQVSAAVTWAGTSYGAPAHPAGGNSSIKLAFPSDGLYQFKLSATAGRYQLLLGQDFLKKTATSAAATEFTAFVPAGTQALTVVQDPAAASTGWNIEISPTPATGDTLPYSRTSSAFGGTGDAFSDEWLPLQAAAGQPVNIKVSAVGATGDSLKVELYNGDTLAYTAANVYGGEVLWSTSTLNTGTNRIRISSNAGNTGPMTYQVDVVPIPSIPAGWQGITSGNGINSVATINVPRAGAYTMVLTVTEGSAIMLVDVEGTTQNVYRVQPSASTTIIRLPLSAGLHTFTCIQDPSAPRTDWQVSLAPRELGPATVYLPLVVR